MVVDEGTREPAGTVISLGVKHTDEEMTIWFSCRESVTRAASCCCRRRRIEE
jgi:hypothetical protein